MEKHMSPLWVSICRNGPPLPHESETTGHLFRQTQGTGIIMNIEGVEEEK